MRTGILRDLCRTVHRGADREVGAMKKEVYSITELVEMGYPKNMLKNLIHSDNFSSLGFRLAASRNSKTFFYKDKLDRFLEHQMDEQQGVIAC